MNTADELKEIFDRIKEAGGDAGYVVNVLSLIWREEFERKEELDSKGKLPKATHFHPGYVLEARRYEKGMPVEIENPHFNLPASVKGKLFEMNVLIINGNYPLRGTNCILEGKTSNRGSLWGFTITENLSLMKKLV